MKLLLIYGNLISIHVTCWRNNSSSVAVADSPSPAQTQTKSGTLEPPSESQQTDEATTGEISRFIWFCLS